MEIADIIYHLNNYRTYCNWNQFLDSYKLNDNSISYTYIENDEKYEILDLKRNSCCIQEQNKFLYLGKIRVTLEYFNETTIHKIISIEQKNMKKIKLSQFIYVRDAPKFYLKYQSFKIGLY